MKTFSILQSAKALALSAVVAAIAGVPATASAQNALAVHPSNAGAASVPFKGQIALGVTCGVQWTATIPPNSTQLWFTFNWNPKSHIAWTIMDDSVPDSGPSVTMSNIAVDRNSATTATYWITVQNTSGSTKAFEGRYCIL